MANIKDLFKDIQDNKENYISQGKGEYFEERISAKLANIGYVKSIKSDIDNGKDSYKKIKEIVLSEDHEHILKNTFTTKSQHFMVQPFGSQNYPDFLIFDNNRIITIETKFIASKQGKPVWNSGLPRLNGIYLFASREDVTFFLGKNLLSRTEINELHKFFKGLKEYQSEFNNKMNAQKYGFAVYIRKAFQQQKKFNKAAITNFFTNPEREKLEEAVFDCLD
ncbi:hypothetical protein COTS27_00200 [Spirochaetota bacterium]|nr:hypothetical protein COTS27_00200 [Spirochaetota bacterium]